MSTSHTAPASAGFDPLAALADVPASVLKNKFSEVARLAARAPLAVTRHSRREFVILSAEHYAELQHSRRAPLDSLTAEFDQLVAKMNTPKARRAADALFAADAKSLGKAAVKARRAATHG